jgi:3-oxoacyl-[acyl-carrier-protein] synthase II
LNAGLWVTGLGLVTPLGVGVEKTWTRLVRGERAIRKVSLFDASAQRVGIAAEVSDVALPSGPHDVTPSWSRTSAMAAMAADEALRNAQVHVGRARVGLVVGGTTAGMFETEQLLARLHAEPECREALASMLSHPLTSTGDRLQERLGPFVRVRSLASACSSGANAVIVAASWLLTGDVDIVLAGGSDGLCRLTLTGFNALAALDPEPCRPFDRRRRGTSLGEGAGFLVLERAEHAQARGVAPVAELAGWALGAEAHHITNPAPDGAVIASLVERAIERAGLAASDIDYVNAHGTGTPLNDASEAAALARALGREIERIPVSSSKGQIGHTLGAAGAIEAAITALAVSRGTLVPTAGLDEPDPGVPLVHVPVEGRRVGRVRAALSNAFGFGGMDAVLVFREPHGPSGGEERAAKTAWRPPVITGAAVFGPCGLIASNQCATLPEQTFELETPVDADAHLDAMRARRFDRASRLGAVAVERALTEARAPAQGTGVVLGSAYGNVDASAAFMHRIFDRGARSASPAEFPNLVPSSPVGHVSIYAGLRGPAFATADLAASGESAFVQAVQLVAAGQAKRLVAGAVEPKSDIVDRVLAALFAHASSQAHAVRADVAAALVVEDEREARERGARVLARVRQVLEWRSSAQSPLGSLVAPAGPHAEVGLARANGGADALLTGSAGRSASASCAPARSARATAWAPWRSPWPQGASRPGVRPRCWCWGWRRSGATRSSSRVHEPAAHRERAARSHVVHARPHGLARRGAGRVARAPCRACPHAPGAAPGTMGGGPAGYDAPAARRSGARCPRWNRGRPR